MQCVMFFRSSSDRQGYTSFRYMHRRSSSSRRNSVSGEAAALCDGSRCPCGAACPGAAPTGFGASASVVRMTLATRAM
ncbi:hypothetical protein STCU_12203 [Strigomonas culicis]|uniref:Uncharacterized protein n=1 Tax=Strigomonas culicis TaxID=28005 RepID=S9TE62_9TRYP|nr:hypothetical protein STCU_12203 [Strigomonas culicis]|eukprot:EPY15249.1 hypothetical protein STCU_12203 [Strigomonas culicis]